MVTDDIGHMHVPGAGEMCTRNDHDLLNIVPVFGDGRGFFRSLGRIIEPFCSLERETMLADELRERIVNHMRVNYDRLSKFTGFSLGRLWNI